MYAPHTGNPNVRKAREQAPTHAWAQAPSDAHEAAWLPPYAVQPHAPRSTDQSGDERDSDSTHTIDSLDAHLAGLQWQDEGHRQSFSSSGSVDEAALHSTGTQPPVPTLWLGADGSASTAFSPLLFAQAERPTTAGPGVLTPPATAGLPPSVNVGPDLPPSMYAAPSSHPRRPADLSKLSTSGLGPWDLPTPHTPSRLAAFPALSPGHAAMAMGTVDFSSWLDEPVVTSPLYELGASAGWSGVYAGMDAGKTPTAQSAYTRQYRSLKGPRPPATADELLRGAPTEPAPLSASPILSSSVDWWSRDSNAQWRFHFNMQARPSFAQLGAPHDHYATLAVSATSRFLTYCSLLSLADPAAPQPPFLHRALLLAKRDQLPASLAIARCSVAAVAVHLPTSDAWAWNLLERELNALVHEAHRLVAQPRSILTDPPLSFDEAMEMMALVQSLWVYVVMGACHSTPAKGKDVRPPFSRTHRLWHPDLLPDAALALQSLTCMAAAMIPMLGPTHTLASAYVSEPDEDTFLWWGLCESFRRTVLASHALLVLLRYLWQDPGDPTLEGMAVLGSAPFPPRHHGSTATSLPMWSAVMQLELPTAADLFEADTVAGWRSHWDARREQAHVPHTLALFQAHRPSGPNHPRSETQFTLDAYFAQHDEFTNVCLSLLFGLTRPP